MNGLISSRFDFTKGNRPYESMWEYYEEYTDLINLMLLHNLTGDEGRRGRSAGAESGEDFLRMLMKTSVIYEGGVAEDDFALELEECLGYLDRRRNLSVDSDVFLPDVYLKSAFKLSNFEIQCIMLAFLTGFDPKHEKVYTLVNDNTSRKFPTAETALELFRGKGRKAYEYLEVFGPEASLPSLFFEKNSYAGMPVLTFPLILQERVVHFLTDPFSKRFDKDMPWKLLEPDTDLDEMVINREYPDKLASLMDAAYGTPAGDLLLINLCGARGSGRKTLFRHFCRRRSSMCIIVDCAILMNNKAKLEEDLLFICREAIFRRAFLCLDGMDKLLESEDGVSISIRIFKTVSKLIRFLFITSLKEPGNRYVPDGVKLMTINIPEADEASRVILWKHGTRFKRLEGTIDIYQLASRFKFTPGQIARSIQTASDEVEMGGWGKITAEILYSCCYRQVVHNLSENAARVAAAYTWDDIVLPDHEVAELKNACNHVKYNHKVLYEWGFEKKLPYGRGMAVLFAGPPGTGKTMSAQVIAGELHMEIYKIQLSKIISKYIGETEKNLKAIFDEAKKSSVILFFDETEALFSKRTEVKDSHDRYANIEVAYLLQQMEEYEGITIMATNHLEYIDEAFMRRINYIIHFPFPDVEVRRSIWKKMFPQDTPLCKDIDFDFLASKFELTGGHIKNIVLSAAYMAAAENSSVSMKHLVRSSIHELKKNKQLVLRKNLEEYADLMD